MLATGRIEPTIRISVVMRPLNFSFFNRVMVAVSRFVPFVTVDIPGHCLAGLVDALSF